MPKTYTEKPTTKSISEAPAVKRATVKYELHKGAQRFVVWAHDCGWESAWLPTNAHARSIGCPRCHPELARPLTAEQRDLIAFYLEDMRPDMKHPLYSSEATRYDNTPPRGEVWHAKMLTMLRSHFPWRAKAATGRWYLYDSTGACLACFNLDSGHGARLVAAAPAMLLALEAMEREMSERCEYKYDALREQMRQAIALATDH